MEKNKFIVNFLLKEVILKYLFCYILSVITLSVPLIFKINDPWNSWLISFSASIFSLPVIFVIYNLYVSALEKHTQEKISQKINNNVIKVFAQFTYFTEYFYYKLENEKNGDEESLNNICNGVQREHNKKLNNGLPILHKVPPKRDYGRYFCIMAEKGGTSHGGLTEKLSPFFHAKKQEVNAYGR